MASYKVTVTGLPAIITEPQVTDFFTFCGKVNSVQISDSGEKGKKAIVEFAKPAAVKTALLLSDSELGGSTVTITADEKTIQAAEEASAADNGAASTTTNGASGTESPTGGKEAGGDISQEYKPRAAILAEYLSHGYVLGDKVIARGLALDEKHGISSRFTKFLTDLDERYHVRDKAEATDKAYGITDKAWKGQAKVARYFDRALNTGTGNKLHGFYTELVKNAQDVHTEARRLANLKTNGDQEQSDSTAADASGAATTTSTKA